MLSIRMLNAIEVSDVPKKSSEKSIKCRSEGNKLYGGGNHSKKIRLDILSLYNQSVAYAENDSEDLALAISNRSALLMHSNMFKESLNDIEKSLQITKSDDLKMKLLSRKMKCMSLMDQVDKDKKLNETQEYQAPTIHKVSKTIPCAADCLTITYDKKYGKCVVATEDIPPGRIISIEKGFVLVPKRDKTYTNCSHCLMLACNGIPCNSCSALIYCSEKCRDEAWLQYHDLECLVLAYLRHLDASYKNLTTTIITVRSFIKFIKKEGLKSIVHGVNQIKTNNAKGEFLNSLYDNGVFQSEKFQSFYGLTQEIPKSEDYLYYYTIISKIINFLAEKTDIFRDYKTIVNDSSISLNFIIQVTYELFSIVELHAYSFGESVCYCKNPESCGFACGESKIGSFFSLFSSLLNHSCDENTYRKFTKNQEMTIVAIQTIKKGSQIFANYGTPIQMPKRLRQNKLKEDYNFTCECVLCKNDLPSDLTVLWNSSDVTNLIAKFKKVGINEKSLIVFQGDLPKVTFDETTLKDVIKMCQIIEKTVNSTVACAYLYSIKNYICLYFDKLYSVKIFNVFDSC